jgi:hypothetical protein
MRAMRKIFKTTFASMLALGVCVWVGETRADGLSGDDDIALNSSVTSADLSELSGGSVSVVSADADVTQHGDVDGNTVSNVGSGSVWTGSASNINNGSNGIVMQAANSGMNSLIQQSTTINVVIATPQN